MMVKIKSTVGSSIDQAAQMSQKRGIFFQVEENIRELLKQRRVEKIEGSVYQRINKRDFSRFFKWKKIPSAVCA